MHLYDGCPTLPFRLQQSLQQVETGFHRLLHTTCKHTIGQLEKTFCLYYQFVHELCSIGQWFEEDAAMIGEWTRHALETHLRIGLQLSNLIGRFYLVPNEGTYISDSHPLLGRSLGCNPG